MAANRGQHTGSANETIRNVIFTSVGGQEVRIRLSDAVRPAGRCVIGAATVGPAGQRRQPQRAPPTQITFDGRRSVTVPAGEEDGQRPGPHDRWPRCRTWPSASTSPQATRARHLSTSSAHADRQPPGRLRRPRQLTPATGAFTDPRHRPGTSWTGSRSSARTRKAGVGRGPRPTRSPTASAPPPALNDRWPDFLARRLDRQSTAAEAPGRAGRGHRRQPGAEPLGLLRAQRGRRGSTGTCSTSPGSAP